MTISGFWPTPDTKWGMSLHHAVARSGEPTLPQKSGQLTLFVGDSHASHSLMPGSEQAQKMTAHSGRKCIESFAKHSQLGSLVKTFAGFVSMELDNCLSDLETLGYACQTFVIPACAVDAPHRRDRVWIIANTDQQHDDKRRLRTGEIFGERPEASGVQRSEPISSNSNSKPACAINDETPGLQGIASDTEREGPQGFGAEHRLRKNPAEIQIGGSCRWEPEPSVGRVANGISNRVHRLRGLGNAVVPQIPELIGRAIMS